MNENISIEFAAKIKPLKPINEEFTLCKCYILALGKNGNKSIISKAAVEESLPTLFNIPVVGHIFADNEGNRHMGAHDTELKRDGDGKIQFNVLTVPYGTVPVQNNIHYEKVEERNGEIKTYLTADVILWTGRYPQLKEAIYSQEVFFGQSMEIKAKEICRSKKDKDCIEINRFSFSALCLLGKSDGDKYNFEPCFPSARVEPYRFDEEFMLQFESMKEELGKVQPEPEVEKAADETIPIPDTFSATYEAKRKAIAAALEKLGVISHESVTLYWLVDFDGKFVYVERLTETQTDKQLVKGRMSYEMQGDEVAAVAEASFEPMLLKWLTEEESGALDTQRAELAELQEFKAQAEKAAQEQNESEQKRAFTKIPVGLENTKPSRYGDFFEKYLRVEGD